MSARSRRAVLRNAGIVAGGAALSLPALSAAATEGPDPVLALFAEWQIANAEATKRAWQVSDTEHAFVDLHGGDLAAVFTDKTLDAPYKAYMKDSLPVKTLPSVTPPERSACH